VILQSVICARRELGGLKKMVQGRVVQVGRKAKEEEDGSLGEGKRRKAM
jgi:hypothetical protein